MATITTTSTSSSLNPTATPFLPAISSLPTLSDTALRATLDLLFEPSPELHALALPTMRTLSFASYDDLVATLRDQLLEIAAAVEGNEEGRRRLHAVLGSHPRLGERRREALSEQSREEQRHLRQGDTGAEAGAEELEELGRLNREYEDRFPGLRYVVFVNGRGRGEVMADMRRRIERGDLREEEREGIRAMCDIAADRARKLLGKSAEEAADGGTGGKS
ncbi:Oxo-4-hydroxy-4-carboxy-5-ureidoimidazoline decarboxylase domain-containing protein [Madurella fahalii]|uniref:Oxo-4-hydroxy-4-carboxy-5-ureidoimidazoline decarboxylase domain-containing protein n=1 Tax=Madurella fahalii TaxID=1157608 RepID=A0ABQ0GTF8_9PEZI